MKIVINRGIGRFGLSHKAIMRYATLKGIILYPCILCSKGKIAACGKQNPDFYSSKSPADNKEITSEDLFPVYSIKRNDPLLVQVVEELGEEADSSHATLKIVEIPDDIEWEVKGNDMGFEWVAEVHRTWA